MADEGPLLLSIVELGGYPDFGPLYRQAGFRVRTERSMRRALAAARRERPAVIVAEFNYQSDFRDRTSSLESLMAVVQSLGDVHVIVFYEQEFAHQLKRLSDRFAFHALLPYPIEPDLLRQALVSARRETP